MTGKTFLIYGISKGLGKAITLQIPKTEDRVFGISRSKPDFVTSENTSIQWIESDLSNPIESSKAVKAQIGTTPIDCLIYNVGIWEHNAFSDTYDFKNNTPEEIINLIQTNISSCILAIQAFIENLKASRNAKIILIGSTWGLDNHNGMEVTFSATKFALRGVVHSLRENLRADAIGVSILNLGYLATEYTNNEPVETVLKETDGELIPLQDALLAIQFILATSSASCVKEITMPAMKDTNM